MKSKKLTNRTTLRWNLHIAVIQLLSQKNILTFKERWQEITETLRIAAERHGVDQHQKTEKRKRDEILWKFQVEQNKAKAATAGK